MNRSFSQDYCSAVGRVGASYIWDWELQLLAKYFFQAQSQGFKGRWGRDFKLIYSEWAKKCPPPMKKYRNQFFVTPRKDALVKTYVFVSTCVNFVHASTRILFQVIYSIWIIDGGLSQKCKNIEWLMFFLCIMHPEMSCTRDWMNQEWMTDAMSELVAIPSTCNRTPTNLHIEEPKSYCSCSLRKIEFVWNGFAEKLQYSGAFGCAPLLS